MPRRSSRVEAVNFGGREIDVAFRVQPEMQMASGQAAVDELDGGDLDDPVTHLGVEPGGLGVEQKLAHERCNDG